MLKDGIVPSFYCDFCYLSKSYLYFFVLFIKRLLKREKNIKVNLKFHKIIRIQASFYGHNPSKLF